MRRFLSASSADCPARKSKGTQTIGMNDEEFKKKTEHKLTVVVTRMYKGGPCAYHYPILILNAVLRPSWNS